MQSIKSIFKYRQFIIGSIYRNFQLKHRDALLGWTWRLLSPFLMILIYMTVFSQIMPVKFGAADEPFSYGVFLCVGVITWGFFIQTVEQLLVTFIQNAELIKKTGLPRICLPVVAVATAAVDFAIMFAIFFIVAAALGSIGPSFLLMAAPALAVLAILAMGLGLLLGVANVFFRDVEQVFRIGAQFWFWLTPVVYPISILPDGVQDVIGWNPLTPLMLSLQAAAISGDGPEWGSLAYPAAVALLMLFLGARLFRRCADDMADEL